MKQPKKLIFVDYDGVMIPQSDGVYPSCGNTFEGLAETYHLDRNEYDLIAKTYPEVYDRFVAAYEQFGKTAVEQIKRICRETGAMAVVSSNWKRFGDTFHRDLFRARGMEECYFGVNTCYQTDDISFGRERVLANPAYPFGKDNINSDVYDECKVPQRVAEIWQFAFDHPSVCAICAIDDIYLAPYMEGHFVETYGCRINEKGELDTTDDHRLGLNPSEADEIIAHLSDPGNYLFGRSDR